MQWLVNSRPFEYCIILTIVGNCVVMSMDTHLANGDKTILALQLVKLTAVLMRSLSPPLQEELEPYFMGIFTVEMCTKIVAMGFVLHPDSYLRNAWNIMDFIVVVSGFLPMLMPKSEEETHGKQSGLDLSTLRTFRVLRPLKLVSGVPSEFYWDWGSPYFPQRIIQYRIYPLIILTWAAWLPLFPLFIIFSISCHPRSPGRHILHSQGYRSPCQHRSAPPLCHHHLRHHRPGVLRRGAQQDLLRRDGPE